MSRAVTRPVINAEPLTRDAFAPFGDVIQTDGARHFPINRGGVERYHDLATVDVGEGGGHTLISIFECRRVGEPPLVVDLMERHPLGSQAFFPVGGAVMCVVVAPPGETLSPGNLRAFVTSGEQGVNYHRGTWHMPLVAFEQGQQFLIVDRGGPGDNCEERPLDPPVEVHIDANSVEGLDQAPWSPLPQGRLQGGRR